MSKLDNLNGGCICVIGLFVMLIAWSWCKGIFDVGCLHYAVEVEFEHEAASKTISCLERYHDIIICADQFTESTDILPQYVQKVLTAVVCISLTATMLFAGFLGQRMLEGKVAVNRFVVSIALLISTCLMGRLCFWTLGGGSKASPSEESRCPNTSTMPSSMRSGASYVFPS